MSKTMDEVVEDDDMPVLSGDAFAALQDFYSEKDQREKDFEELKNKAENNEQLQSTPLSMNMFSEDWNASQFWYSDETATLLAKELLCDATATTRIAIVSAPSVFIQIKNLLATGDYGSPYVRLLEYDQRFEVFSEYVQYDFNTPLKLPTELKASFDYALCDPPFLSEDCHTKAAMTVRWLMRGSDPAEKCHSKRTIVCSGHIMESLILKLYSGMRTTSFTPQHAQGRLSNDFGCFANYESEAWTLQ